LSETHPLPCFPCPHSSACCAYGTTLTDDEAAALMRAHGPAVAYQTRWGEWRTRVRHRRCVLFQDNRCVIHGESFYPAVCRGFPWTDAETGGPYEFDRTICPEFLSRPELIPLGKPVRKGRNDGTTERRNGAEATNHTVRGER